MTGRDRRAPGDTNSAPTTSDTPPRSGARWRQSRSLAVLRPCFSSERHRVAPPRLRQAVCPHKAAAKLSCAPHGGTPCHLVSPRSAPRFGGQQSPDLPQEQIPGHLCAKRLGGFQDGLVLQHARAGLRPRARPTPARAMASSCVAPYASVPGSSRTSATQRPSVSTSSSIVKRTDIQASPSFSGPILRAAPMGWHWLATSSVWGMSRRHALRADSAFWRSARCLCWAAEPAAVGRDYGTRTTRPLVSRLSSIAWARGASAKGSTVYLVAGSWIRSRASVAARSSSPVRSSVE